MIHSTLTNTCGAVVMSILEGVSGLAISLVIGLLVGVLLGLRLKSVPNRRRSRSVSARSTERPRKRRAPREASGFSPDSPEGMVEIYVGNLSYDMTEDQLRREFEAYGTVHSSRIITHRMSQRSKGFGFVVMPDRAEAQAAIDALSEHELLGRKLRVNEARDKSRREE